MRSPSRTASDVVITLLLGLRVRIPIAGASTAKRYALFVPLAGSPAVLFACKHSGKRIAFRRVSSGAKSLRAPFALNLAGEPGRSDWELRRLVHLSVSAYSRNEDCSVARCIHRTLSRA